MKIFTILLTLVISVWIGLSSFFTVSNSWGNEETAKAKLHGKRSFTWILDKLSATTDQKREIAVILKNHRDDIGNTITSMSGAGKELRNAITATPYSEDAVRLAAKQKAAIEEQAAVLRAQITSEVRSILTAEQNGRLNQMIDKRSGKINHFITARLTKLDEWIATQLQ
jgi:Spy/CpxP family protein refolding chaperone